MTRFVCRLHVVAVCLGICLPVAMARAADTYPAAGPYQPAAGNGATGASGFGGSYSVAAAPPANPGSQLQMVTASDEAAPYPGDSTVRLIDPSAAAARPSLVPQAKPQAPPSVRAPAGASQKYPVRQASQVAEIPPPPKPDPLQQSHAQPRQQPLPATAMPSGGEVAAPATPEVPDDCNSDYPSCFCGRPGAWFGGADYMFLRPHQPGNSAFEISPNGGSGSEVENVNFGSPFNSSFRTFLGYRTACDEAIQFSYMHITNSVTESADVADGDVINSPLGASLNPGDVIAATNHLLLNIWDVEDVRPLNLSSCNCNRNCCPDWQANWSWGVRFMDLKQNVTNVVTGPDAGFFSQQSTFVGAGPRVGLEIRRQLGHTATSAFISADAALLVGDQRTTGSDTPSGFHATQAVPDFDFRVGLSWQPTCHINVTSGWIFETFSDATMLNQSAGLALLQPPQASSLSYDGLFIRGEFSF